MTEQDFDEFLDEAYPVFRIGELTFYPSQILKNCDPIAYRIGLSEWEDEEDDNQRTRRINFQD